MSSQSDKVLRKTRLQGSTHQLDRLLALRCPKDSSYPQGMSAVQTRRGSKIRLDTLCTPTDHLSWWHTTQLCRCNILECVSLPEILCQMDMAWQLLSLQDSRSLLDSVRKHRHKSPPDHSIQQRMYRLHRPATHSQVGKQ